MFSIGGIVWRADRWRNCKRVRIDLLEVDFAGLFPSSEYSVSTFAQIGRTHGTGVHFPRRYSCGAKGAAAIAGNQERHVPVDTLRCSAIKDVQGTALVCKCTHAATPACPESRRRNGDFSS